jgi:hypothetical protein
MSSRAAFSRYCGRVNFPNEAATTFAERVKSSVPVGRRKEEGRIMKKEERRRKGDEGRKTKREEDEVGRRKKEGGKRKKEEGKRKRAKEDERVQLDVVEQQ